MTDELEMNMDKLASDMKEVRARLAPILEKELDGIDLKSSTIFFASLVKEILKETDDENFKELILRYMFD
jgi:hypothetical protein